VSSERADTVVSTTCRQKSKKTWALTLPVHLPDILAKI